LRPAEALCAAQPQAAKIHGRSYLDIF